jgi:hypothetical protein
MGFPVADEYRRGLRGGRLPGVVQKASLGRLGAEPEDDRLGLVGIGLLAGYR